MTDLKTEGALVPVCDSSDRETWLEQRRLGVTATDVARIASLSAASLRRALADKRGELADFRNAAMQHGSEREDAIAAWVDARFRIAPSHTLFAHPENPRYLATPDGVGRTFDFAPSLAEIKTTRNDWSGPSTLYQRQMQWQMFVTGAEHVLFVWEQHDDDYQPVDMEPRFVWVKRDQGQIDELRAAADLLLGLMDEEPLPDPAVDADIDEVLALDAEIKALKVQRDTVEQRIREHIGERSSYRAFGTHGNLTFSTSTSRRFAQTEFGKDHPDLLEQYKRPSTSSRLTITPLAAVKDEEVA